MHQRLVSSFFLVLVLVFASFSEAVAISLSDIVSFQCPSTTTALYVPQWKPSTYRDAFYLDQWLDVVFLGCANSNFVVVRQVSQPTRLVEQEPTAPSGCQYHAFSRDAFGYYQGVLGLFFMCEDTKNVYHYGLSGHSFVHIATVTAPGSVFNLFSSTDNARIPFVVSASMALGSTTTSWSQYDTVSASLQTFTLPVTSVALLVSYRVASSCSIASLKSRFFYIALRNTNQKGYSVMETNAAGAYSSSAFTANWVESWFAWHAVDVSSVHSMVVTNLVSFAAGCQSRVYALLEYTDGTQALRGTVFIPDPPSGYAPFSNGANYVTQCTAFFGDLSYDEYTDTVYGICVSPYKYVYRLTAASSDSPVLDMASVWTEADTATCDVFVSSIAVSADVATMICSHGSYKSVVIKTLSTSYFVTNTPVADNHYDVWTGCAGNQIAHPGPHLNTMYYQMPQYPRFAVVCSKYESWYWLFVYQSAVDQTYNDASLLRRKGVSGECHADLNIRVLCMFNTALVVNDPSVIVTSSLPNAAVSVVLAPPYPQEQSIPLGVSGLGRLFSVKVKCWPGAGVVQVEVCYGNGLQESAPSSIQCSSQNINNAALIGTLSWSGPDNAFQTTVMCDSGSRAKVTYELATGCTGKPSAQWVYLPVVFSSNHFYKTTNGGQLSSPFSVVCSGVDSSFYLYVYTGSASQYESGWMARETGTDTTCVRDMAIRCSYSAQPVSEQVSLTLTETTVMGFNAQLQDTTSRTENVLYPIGFDSRGAVTSLLVDCGMIADFVAVACVGASALDPILCNGDGTWCPVTGNVCRSLVVQYPSTLVSVVASAGLLQAPMSSAWFQFDVQCPPAAVFDFRVAERCATVSPFAWSKRIYASGLFYSLETIQWPISVVCSGVDDSYKLFVSDTMTPLSGAGCNQFGFAVDCSNAGTGGGDARFAEFTLASPPPGMSSPTSLMLYANQRLPVCYASSVLSYARSTCDWGTLQHTDLLCSGNSALAPVSVLLAMVPQCSTWTLATNDAWHAYTLAGCSISLNMHCGAPTTYTVPTTTAPPTTTTAPPTVAPTHTAITASVQVDCAQGPSMVVSTTACTSLDFDAVYPGMVDCDASGLYSVTSYQSWDCTGAKFFYGGIASGVCINVFLYPKNENTNPPLAPVATTIKVDCIQPPVSSSAAPPYSSSPVSYSSSVAAYSSSATPFSSSDAPHSSSDAPHSSSAAPYSSSAAPYSSSDTPHSSSLSSFSSSAAPHSSSDTPYSSSVTPYSSSVTPYSSSATPYSSSVAPTTGVPTTLPPTTARALVPVSIVLGCADSGAIASNFADSGSDVCLHATQNGEDFTFSVVCLGNGLLDVVFFYGFDCSEPSFSHNGGASGVCMSGLSAWATSGGGGGGITNEVTVSFLVACPGTTITATTPMPTTLPPTTPVPTTPVPTFPVGPVNTSIVVGVGHTYDCYSNVLPTSYYFVDSRVCMTVVRGGVPTYFRIALSVDMSSYQYATFQTSDCSGPFAVGSASLGLNECAEIASDFAIRVYLVPARVSILVSVAMYGICVTLDPSFFFLHANGDTCMTVRDTAGDWVYLRVVLIDGVYYNLFSYPNSDCSGSVIVGGPFIVGICQTPSVYRFSPVTNSSSVGSAVIKISLPGDTWTPLPPLDYAIADCSSGLAPSQYQWSEPSYVSNHYYGYPWIGGKRYSVVCSRTSEQHWVFGLLATATVPIADSSIVKSVGANSSVCHLGLFAVKCRVMQSPSTEYAVQIQNRSAVVEVPATVQSSLVYPLHVYDDGAVSSASVVCDSSHGNYTVTVCTDLPLSSSTSRSFPLMAFPLNVSHCVSYPQPASSVFHNYSDHGFLMSIHCLVTAHSSSATPYSSSATPYSSSALPYSSSVTPTATTPVPTTPVPTTPVPTTPVPTTAVPTTPVVVHVVTYTVGVCLETAEIAQPYVFLSGVFYTLLGRTFAAVCSGVDASYTAYAYNGLTTAPYDPNLLQSLWWPDVSCNDWGVYLNCSHTTPSSNVSRVSSVVAEHAPARLDRELQDSRSYVVYLTSSGLGVVSFVCSQLLPTYTVVYCEGNPVLSPVYAGSPYVPVCSTYVRPSEWSVYNYSDRFQFGVNCSTSMAVTTPVPVTPPPYTVKLPTYRIGGCDNNGAITLGTTVYTSGVFYTENVASMMVLCSGVDPSFVIYLYAPTQGQSFSRQSVGSLSWPNASCIESPGMAINCTYTDNAGVGKYAVHGTLESASMQNNRFYLVPSNSSVYSFFAFNCSSDSYVVTLCVSNPVEAPIPLATGYKPACVKFTRPHSPELYNYSGFLLSVNCSSHQDDVLAEPEPSTASTLIAGISDTLVYAMSSVAAVTGLSGVGYAGGVYFYKYYSSYAGRMALED